MYHSYARQDSDMRCFLALGLKPRLPMSRVQKIKAFLFGLLHRIGHNG